ncbi:DUF763 domain-containing protein [Candidatus Margulisiibacteriota bacterium]
MKTGIANLPLHGGKAPAWLFQRMVKLASAMIEVIISEYGSHEFLRRVSDPFWFQGFGCVLGFDWHSSGVTTTVCGAIKEGIKYKEKDLGLFVCGGKGRASRKTPIEIQDWGEKLSKDTDHLVYASKMSAKVDTTAIQDGYQLYHHLFLFDTNLNWSVVQQGMNEHNKYARRYHWLSHNKLHFVQDPHTAICCDSKSETLNLATKESEDNQNVSTELSREMPYVVMKELQKLQTISLPRRHAILQKDIKPRNFEKVLVSTYEKQPQNFEELLGTPGLGPKSLRSLSLISELVFGKPASWKDPVKYSFAHGGKDGTPYPVDRKTYDRSVDYLEEVIHKSKIDYTEKEKAFKRLKLLNC